MNLRLDETVHAVFEDETMPACGRADIPACAPELTSDAVNCWECESLIG